jgi:hypothetical protein
MKGWFWLSVVYGNLEIRAVGAREDLGREKSGGEVWADLA